METTKKSLLQVDFQDGFNKDTIEVKIYDKDAIIYDDIWNDVSTDLRISLAKSFRVDVFNGDIKLDVAVLSKNLSFSQNLYIDSDKYISVSILNPEGPNADIKASESKGPPHYL